METSAPGWYVDPTGRHAYRYWTGDRWSGRVDDPSGPSVDPLGLMEAGSADRGPDEGSSRPKRPRRRRRRLVAVLFVLVLLCFGTAVGGLLYIMSSEDSGPKAVADPPDPLVDSLKQYITTTSLGAVDNKDATCMARSIIDTVGRARLIEVGIQNGADPLTALSRQEVQSDLPKAMECLDNEGVEVMIARTLKPSVLGRLNAESPECLVRGWMDGLGRPTLVRIYALWASGAGAEMTKVLEPEKLGILGQVIADCKAQDGATTTAPPAP